MQTSTERRLAEARQELAQHERQGIILKKEVAALETILGIDGDHPPHEPPPNGSVYGSKRHRMETAIEGFLRQNGKPMHRMQIKDYLIELGIVGDEFNPIANVSNILSTSKKFKSKGNGLWGLTEP
jgi:hypothetical protein